MAMCALAYPLLAYWVSREYARGSGRSGRLLTGQCRECFDDGGELREPLSRASGTNLAFSFTNSVVTLLVVYPLTVRWGVTGASLAGLLGATNVPVFFWYVHRKILHLSSRASGENVPPSLLANVPLGVVVYFLVAPRTTSLTSALAGVCVLGFGSAASAEPSSVKTCAPWWSCFAFLATARRI